MARRHAVGCKSHGWWAGHLHEFGAEMGEGRQQLRRVEPQFLEQLLQILSTFEI